MNLPFVIPAKAGIQCFPVPIKVLFHCYVSWIPAFAGTTSFITLICIAYYALLLEMTRYFISGLLPIVAFKYQDDEQLKMTTKKQRFKMPRK